MKKNRLIAILCAVICCLTLVTSALAIDERSSELIRQYSISSTVSGETINVDFSVSTYQPMNHLGCESISVYKKEGTRWVYVDGKSENASGMSKAGSLRHSNTISFACVSGAEYKVDVTIFAEDSNGRDTRSKTTYLTGR